MQRHCRGEDPPSLYPYVRTRMIAAMNWCANAPTRHTTKLVKVFPPNRKMARNKSKKLTGFYTTSVTPTHSCAPRRGLHSMSPTSLRALLTCVLQSEPSQSCKLYGVAFFHSLAPIDFFVAYCIILTGMVAISAENQAKRDNWTCLNCLPAIALSGSCIALRRI